MRGICGAKPEAAGTAWLGFTEEMAPKYEIYQYCPPNLTQIIQLTNKILPCTVLINLENFRIFV